MTRYVLVSNTNIKEIYVNTPFTDYAGFQHPGNWADVFSNTNFTNLGIEILTEAQPPAPGYQIATKQITIDDGVPTEHLTYKPIDVPSEISMLQARMILLSNDLLDSVDTYVTNTGNTELQTFWNYASAIHRDHPLLLEVGPALGLSNSQIDQMFIAGSLIS